MFEKFFRGVTLYQKAKALCFILSGVFLFVMGVCGFIGDAPTYGGRGVWLLLALFGVMFIHGAIASYRQIKSRMLDPLQQAFEDKNVEKHVRAYIATLPDAERLAAEEALAKGPLDTTKWYFKIGGRTFPQTQSPNASAKKQEGGEILGGR